MEAVAVCAVIVVWFALQGGFVPPAPRSGPKYALTRHNVRRFSLRALFLATTLVAALLCLGVWLEHF